MISREDERTGTTKATQEKDTRPVLDDEITQDMIEYRGPYFSQRIIG